MAVFANEIVDNRNLFLKQPFNGHSARGKQKATGQTACGCSEASVTSRTNARGPAMGVFQFCTKKVVCNCGEHTAQVWLGGVSPWVRRTAGISPAPQVGPLYSEGVS